jgi:hypothetical protein
MDKSERKRIKRELKEKELREWIEIESKSEDSEDVISASIMKKFIQDKLGIESNALTNDILQNTDDSELVGVIWDKLNNYSSCLYKKNPKHFKSPNRIINSLCFERLFIYCYHDFLGQYELGNLESYLFNVSPNELQILIKGFDQIGFPELGFGLEKLEDEMTHKFYQSNRKQIEESITKFIRDNIELYEVK